jgi:hypothetical protein
MKKNIEKIEKQNETGATQTVKFCGTVAHESEKSLFIWDGIEEVQIPKSQIFLKRVIRGKDCELIIPEWLAVDKGIV